MKTFFKLFGIMLAMLAVISCSEDIWVHDGADGKDGRDGVDGVDGKDAENPAFTTEKTWISDLCWIRTILLNGEFFYEDTICNGQDGEDGKDFDPNSLIFTSEVIELNDLCDMIFCYLNDSLIFAFENCDGAPGEDGQDAEPYTPDWEIEKNQISELCKEIVLYVDGNEIFKDTICNGQDGEDGEDGSGNIYIDLPDFQEEFNNPGGTGHYLDKGWEFSDKVVVDQKNSPYGNGTVYLEDLSIGSGWARTPIFPWMTITFIEVTVGSNEIWEMDVYAQKRSNKEWVFLGTKVIGGTPNLLWYDQTTYGESFTYIIPSLEDSEHQDFERVEVNFWKNQDEKKGVKCETDRNSSCNIPSIKVAGVRIIQE